MTQDDRIAHFALLCFQNRFFLLKVECVHMACIVKSEVVWVGCQVWTRRESSTNHGERACSSPCVGTDAESYNAVSMTCRTSFCHCRGVCGCSPELTPSKRERKLKVCIGCVVKWPARVPCSIVYAWRDCARPLACREVKASLWTTTYFAC